MKRFAQFDLEELIDQGGNAAVYRATNSKYPLPVAVKIIHPHLVSQEIAEEPVIIHNLQHAHIVPILEHGRFEGRPYTVMPFMSGGSLNMRLKGIPMTLARVIDILQPIAQALDYAHSNDVIHRDVKPANVLFDASDTVYLADFGLAKLMKVTTGAGQSSGLFGTADYLSPEQAQDQSLDGRTDQYSLAVMAYEMLSGKRPFAANSPINLALQHISAPIPDIQQDNPHLPAYITSILQKGLAKEPQARYETCVAFVQALQIPPTIQAEPSPQKHESTDTRTVSKLREISRFLYMRLTGDELVDFIQYEYKLVYYNLAQGMTRQQQIRLLIDHVHVEQSLAELVVKLKSYYPERATNL